MDCNSSMEESNLIRKRSRTFNEIVKDSHDFSNPYHLDYCSKHFDLNIHGSMTFNNPFCPPFYRLRNSQSKQYINEA